MWLLHIVWAHIRGNRTDSSQEITQKISHLIKPTSAKVRDILRMLLVDVGCCCSLHLKNLVQSGNCILFPTRTEKFLGFCSLWEVCVTQENRTKRFKNSSLYDEPYENTEDTLVLNTH